MRGKGGFHLFAADRQGITPAYAGKSCGVSKAAAERRDHPRLCGEKKKSWNRLQSTVGSPPPMRGKAIDFTDATDLFGITPAYAGKRIN